MKGPSGSDRRTAPRHPLRVPLTVRLWKSTLPAQKSISRNLSMSGAQFPTQLPVALGTVVELWLKMPEEISGEEAAEWRCSGHVVRIEEKTSFRNKKKAEVAIQFDCYEVARHVRRQPAVNGYARLLHAAPVSPGR